MYTATFDKITAHAGEPIEITFTVTDAAGEDVSVDGATATFKVARTASAAALLTKTQASGITLAGNTAIVSFGASEIQSGGAQLIDDFVGQLTITKDGSALVVAEGRISISPVIQ